MPTRIHLAVATSLIALCACAMDLRADDPPVKPEVALALDQARLAERFKELKKKMLHLAEMSAARDPRRSSALRQVIAGSEEKELDQRFAALSERLEKGPTAFTERDQAAVKKDLEALLELLLKEDRDSQREKERRRVQQLIKEVGRIIKEQRGVKARNEGGDDLEKLAGDQERITAKTGDLADQIAEEERRNAPGEGEPGEEEPGEAGDGEQPGEKKPVPPSNEDSGDGEKQPENNQPSPGPPQPAGGEQSETEDQPQSENQRAGKRLQAARQRMRQAQQKLKDAERKGAADEQQKAIEELEQAKAELERILRQLREEEIERVLAALEDRFRQMLARQNETYEATVRLDEVPAGDRGRDEEIEAGRLSREEAQLVREADRALSLLRDEGTAVAFPEAVGQMRDDMEQVVVLLAQAKTGKLTQAIEKDIIVALEEMIAALDRAQKDAEERRNQQNQPSAPVEAGEQALIDQLAELRMIRALQVRINKMTDRYRIMLEASGPQADVQKALERLAGRQLRIYQITRDIHLGKNQ